MLGRKTNKPTPPYGFILKLITITYWVFNVKCENHEAQRVLRNLSKVMELVTGEKDLEPRFAEFKAQFLI